MATDDQEKKDDAETRGELGEVEDGGDATADSASKDAAPMKPSATSESSPPPPEPKKSAPPAAEASESPEPKKSAPPAAKASESPEPKKSAPPAAKASESPEPKKSAPPAAKASESPEPKKSAPPAAEPEESPGRDSDPEAAAAPEPAASEPLEGEETAAGGEDGGAGAPPPEVPPLAADDPPDGAPERMRRARARGGKPTQAPPPAASLGKSVFLFLGVFVLLAMGFAFLSSSDPFSEKNAPKWRKGQKVQLHITLDPRDDVKLSCASKGVVDGKRCEYESKTQRASGQIEDKTLLRPYTTTDGVQFLAAGLWTQPGLEKEKRPRERFTVACQFTVDGSISSPAVRWDPAGSWNEKNQNWFAGSVSDCKVQKD